jgi:polyhydroxyalkanoate synthesis repressor PhaR
MERTRIIKRYPNRRLYDTVESRYVTLADLRRLVVERVDFSVLEQKTGADITRAMLLQLIAEQEQEGEPIMSEEFLAQVIRAYGGAMQGFVGSYLEQSLKLFMAQQQQIRDRMRSMVGIDPLGAVVSLAEKNLAQWRAAQESRPPAPERQRPGEAGPKE